MKKCQLFILLLFLLKSSFAQTSNFDELPLPILRQKLSLSKNDTNTVKLQLALGHLMLLKATRGDKDIDSAKEFSVRAAALSHQLDYQFGIINSMLLSTETSYYQNNKDKGLVIAQNALAFSKLHNNSDGEARSYYLIAQYYPTYDSVSLRKRILYINKAIAIFKKNGNIHWLSFMLTGNADLLCQAERPTEGLKLLFEALNLGKEVSRRNIEGIYWNIGRISMGIGNYSNALKYYHFALRTAREVNDTTMQVAYIKHLIASTYINLENYEQAIPYSIDVLRISLRYNSLYFINMESSALASEYTHTNRLSKALAILNEMKRKAGSKLDKLSVSVDFLNSLVYTKHFFQARQYEREVINLLPEIPPNNRTVIMNVYKSLAFYYSETNQLKKAQHYTELYVAIAHRQNFIDGITLAENRHYKLAISSRSPTTVIGNFLKDQAVRDSANNKVKAYQTFLLEMENETLAKNKHIDSLTLAAQIKDIKLKRNQLIQKATIFGGVMLLTITGLIYSRYKLKQRSNALLTKQKEEIDQKNTALQRLILDKNELLKDKDELLLEKELLFKEINHRVKNNLQSIMLLLENQAATLNGEAFDAVNISRHRIYAMSLVHDKLIESSKFKSVNMGRYLPQLIEHIRDSFQGPTKVNIRISIEELVVDVALALPLALIVNEALTNAFKYAFTDIKNGRICVVFGKVKEQLRLEIADNGIGINDETKTKNYHGMGMKLIHGLCEDIDAKITIKSPPGTCIVILCNSNESIEDVNLDIALNHLPDLDIA